MKNFRFGKLVLNKLAICYGIALLLLNCVFINCRLICPQSKDIISPVDLSYYRVSTHVNVFLYFSSLAKSLRVRPIFYSDHIQLSVNNGNWGSLTLDGNSNYDFGEEKIRYNYVCTEMRISLPSFNKFWGSQVTELELLIYCNKKDYIDKNHILKNYLEDKLVLTFPVINIEAEKYGSDDHFFSNLVESLLTISFSKTQDYKSYNSFTNLTYTLDNFSVEKDFLYEGAKTGNNQFYFYNGNDVINCNDEVTWVIFNNFLKISSKNYNVLNTTYKNLTIDIADEINNYYQMDYRPNINLNISRNFYINENYKDFENFIITSSKNKASNQAQYLKVISKIVFIILIVIFYE